MSIGPLSQPYLLVPAIAAAQVVNVSLPGQEPDPSRMVSEDLALFDKELMTSKGESTSTRDHLASNEALAFGTLPVVDIA